MLKKYYELQEGDISVMQLEDFDLGQPTNPKIRIIKEWEVMDFYKPYAIQNQDWNWLYNFEAAKLEAKLLWKKIPTYTQWSKLAKTRIYIYNISYAGFSNSGSCYNRGVSTFYWAQSVYSPNPNCAWTWYLHYDSRYAYRNTNDKSCAFSVRCLKN